MESPLLLNLLWLVPVIVWLITRNKSFPGKGVIRGVSFGLVVSPASLGLYALYYVGPVAAIFGMLGLLLSIFHEAAGYQLAVAFNLVPSHTVVEGGNRITIECINAVFWSFVYGALGFAYGNYKNKKSRNN